MNPACDNESCKYHKLTLFAEPARFVVETISDGFRSQRYVERYKFIHAGRVYMLCQDCKEEIDNRNAIMLQGRRV